MILYPVGYNTPPSRVTLDVLNKRADWVVLDPEFRRRLLAMFDASNGTVGIGGGGRTTAQQRDLFLSRYVVSATGSTAWDGKLWAKKAGVASAAPPGGSYHEATTPAGHALAADLIGDLAFVHSRGAEFGMHDFAAVNSEPWHVQPVEIPNSRSKYVPAVHALARPAAPTPTPAPIEDDDMGFRAVIKGEDAAHHPVLVVADGAGVHMTGLTNPVDVTACCRLLGQAQPEPVSNTLWADLLAKALASAPKGPATG